ncbi:transporter substrate-binding domain-containing protein [Vibrio sp. SCSIO 43136]|uniref:substrate-binding periplasmic protein n=1 Tax=Vibrio sp. SCSIO 43136 TaxID=2819101 RepID=UPI002074C58E|nr:transporter substrate-binding domain-containing protein [Vibrio sp. SCSIO 43136]USD67904.1 transporter substrate-binding domain-containing protein [Vibrio sp. SCSIO 43136]
MSGVRRIWLILFVALLTSFSSVANIVNHYTILTYESRPLAYSENGKHKGLLIELIDELFKRSQFEYTIKIMPLKRAMNIARLQNNHCVLPVARSQEREADFQWVSPVLVTRYALYADLDHDRDIVTLADVRNHTIGTHRGSIVDEYLSSMGFTTEPTSTSRQNFRKLEIGRIDFWAEDTLTATPLMESLGYHLLPELVFYTSLRAMACNLSSNPYKMRKMELALSKMYWDGYLEKLYAKYGLELNPVVSD